MTKTSQDLGRRGEQLAADKLLSSGFEIVARNYHCVGGEIDLVTRLAEVWVFVEVRTRRSRKYGTPEESITRSKKKHLITAAQTYLQDQDLTNVDWRIDLVAIEVDAKGQVLRMDIVENAVNAL